MRRVRRPPVAVVGLGLVALGGVVAVVGYLVLDAPEALRVGRAVMALALLVLLGERLLRLRRRP